MIDVELDVELEWDSPIGCLLPELSSFPGCQVLTFIKKIQMPFLPAIGMILFESSRGIRDHASDYDPIDVEVESVNYWMEDGSVFVRTNRLKMGKAPATKEELLKDIEWMRWQGYEWREERRRAAPAAAGEGVKG